MDHHKKATDASIAWYKLADLIAKHEREKALNVYRLLSHSFDDKAYALQLEGDILLGLEDAQAVEKYKQAAFLYSKESRWINAICVCEHLVQVQAENADLMGLLLDLYLKVGWKDKFDDLLTTVGEKLSLKKLDEDTLFKGFKRLLESDHAGEYQSPKGWVVKHIKSQEKKLPDGFFDRLKRLL